MIKHRHHARWPREGDRRTVLCGGKQADCVVQDGWWTCARCGKKLWEVPERNATVDREPGTGAP